MPGYSFLDVAPLRLPGYSVRRYQTIASSREAAYREWKKADRALRAATTDHAITPARLTRLHAAAKDAAALHYAWVIADRQAALAGALD